VLERLVQCDQWQVAEVRKSLLTTKSLMRTFSPRTSNFPSEMSKHSSGNKDHAGLPNLHGTKPLLHSQDAAGHINFNTRVMPFFQHAERTHSLCVRCACIASLHATSKLPMILPLGRDFESGANQARPFLRLGILGRA
jgi:hypothetical protein